MLKFNFYHPTHQVWLLNPYYLLKIEYSAIEGLFGNIKCCLKDFKFKNKEDLANKIIEIAF